MGLTELAIQRKRVTGTALVVILLTGLSSYNRMSRAEDPGFIIRTALVMTIFPGASPESVEQLVTDKIEKVVVNRKVVEGTATPLYIYAKRQAGEVGGTSA